MAENQWVTGVIVPIHGVATRLITGRGSTLHKVTPAQTAYCRGFFFSYFFVSGGKELGGGFKDFLFSPLLGGNDPI